VVSNLSNGLPLGFAAVLQKDGARGCADAVERGEILRFFYDLKCMKNPYKVL
jgi:hypothetical protein